MINLQLSDEEVLVLYNVLEREYHRLAIQIAPPNQTQGTREKRIIAQNNISGILETLKPFI